MLDQSPPDELRSEGRGVKTTGGARARRGVVFWFRRVDVPDPHRGEKWWRGVVAGDGHARAVKFPAMGPIDTECAPMPHRGPIGVL